MVVFLDDPKFTSAYTYFKNTSQYAYVSPPVPLEFISVYAGSNTYAPPFPYTEPIGLTGEVTFDDTDNSIQLSYVTWEILAGSFTDQGTHIIQS